MRSSPSRLGFRRAAFPGDGELGAANPVLSAMKVAGLSSHPRRIHFIRLEYTDFHNTIAAGDSHPVEGMGKAGGWSIGQTPMTTSAPAFRLTRIDTGDPRHLRLTDDRLFDYPWIYATQTGWWGLSDAETARLREYLLRGGFLVVDDFWGDERGKCSAGDGTRPPGPRHRGHRQSDSVMHVLYDIEDKDHTFIPGTRHLRRGPGGTVIVQQP